jgi:hypothetical protein
MHYDTYTSLKFLLEFTDRKDFHHSTIYFHKTKIPLKKINLPGGRAQGYLLKAQYVLSKYCCIYLSFSHCFLAYSAITFSKAILPTVATKQDIQ